MIELSEGWSEITYRYIEHYFWEPQHLIRTERSIEAAKARGESRVEAVYRNLHSQEVPLNYLLNVMLRIIPSSFRYKLLQSFYINTNDPGLQRLVLKTPGELEYIQPDVHLESDSSRVFIETKVTSQLTIAQIEKYIRLQKELNTEQEKRSYILFLVNRDKLKLKNVKDEFEHADVGRNIPLLLQTNGIVFGSVSWRLFAEKLLKELEKRRGEHDDFEEMLDTLVGDFLSDLKERRHLL